MDKSKILKLDDTLSIVRYKVQVEFITPLLGTVPMDPDVYATYVASQIDHDDLEEELETLETAGVEEKGWTTFHKLNDQPLLYDYVIKGFCKSACSALRRVKGSRSSKVTAYLKKIDGLLMPEPRRIMLTLPEGGEIEQLPHQIRCKTPRGERIALGRSDMCPIGTSMEFVVATIGDNVIAEKILKEWFAYGQYHGFGQWRNGGWGRFIATLECIS